MYIAAHELYALQNEGLLEILSARNQYLTFHFVAKVKQAERDTYDLHRLMETFPCPGHKVTCVLASYGHMVLHWTDGIFDQWILEDQCSTCLKKLLRTALL